MIEGKVSGIDCLGEGMQLQSTWAGSSMVYILRELKNKGFAHSLLDTFGLNIQPQANGIFLIHPLWQFSDITRKGIV